MNYLILNNKLYIDRFFTMTIGKKKKLIFQVSEGVVEVFV